MLKRMNDQNINGLILNEKFKKDIADDNDAESIKKKMGEFTQATQAVVMKLYQQNQGANTEGAANADSGAAQDNK